ncbi:LemA family protein [uncultured Maricaulis sp.]|uniref:LemA family protein n=1 Tax=uncultured Maricaulis sp. TaxID=174710 RepID=UPI0030DA5339|tara:strand:+ start:49392 stop:49943 length:552 start_codon:yes stop_codon:yes gene_type:complete
MDASIILLIVVIVVGFILVGIYNRLVALRQTCNQAWGDVDVQLKQRHDVIPNLVETVKGYAKHETDTLENVIKARQAAIVAPNVKELAGAENMLSGALRQLFALSESYPDLKANQNFMQLQSELSDLENKIAAARRFFNNAVAEFNTAIEQFPAVLMASMFGFAKRDFFEVAEAERAAPQVKF